MQERSTRLREERQKRGWTLTYLTSITGIATCDLSQVERDLRPAFPGWRKRIAHAFGMAESELFKSDGGH